MLQSFIRSFSNPLVRSLDGASSGGFDPAVVAFAANSGATEIQKLNAFAKAVISDPELDWSKVYFAPLVAGTNTRSGTIVHTLRGDGVAASSNIQVSSGSAEYSWTDRGMRTRDRAYFNTTFPFDPTGWFYVTGTYPESWPVGNYVVCSRINNGETRLRYGPTDGSGNSYAWNFVEQQQSLVSGSTSYRDVQFYRGPLSPSGIKGLGNGTSKTISYERKRYQNKTTDGLEGILNYERNTQSTIQTGGDATGALGQYQECPFFLAYNGNLTDEQSNRLIGYALHLVIYPILFPSITEYVLSSGHGQSNTNYLQGVAAAALRSVFNVTDDDPFSWSIHRYDGQGLHNWVDTDGTKLSYQINDEDHIARQCRMAIGPVTSIVKFQFSGENERTNSDNAANVGVRLDWKVGYDRQAYLDGVQARGWMGNKTTDDIPAVIHLPSYDLTTYGGFDQATKDNHRLARNNMREWAESDTRAAAIDSFWLTKADSNGHIAGGVGGSTDWQTGAQLLLPVVNGTQPANLEARAVIYSLLGQGVDLDAGERSAIETFIDSVAWSKVTNMVVPIWGTEKANSLNWKTREWAHFKGAWNHADGYAEGNGTDTLVAFGDYHDDALDRTETQLFGGARSNTSFMISHWPLTSTTPVGGTSYEVGQRQSNADMIRGEVAGNSITFRNGRNGESSTFNKGSNWSQNDQGTIWGFADGTNTLVFLNVGESATPSHFAGNTISAYGGADAAFCPFGGYNDEGSGTVTYTREKARLYLAANNLSVAEWRDMAEAFDDLMAGLGQPRQNEIWPANV